MKKVTIIVVIALLIGILGYFINDRGLSTFFNPNKAERDLMNKSASSETIIQLNVYGRRTHSLPSPNSNRTGMMTRQFFLTQFSVIKSEETINRAMLDYRLDELFEVDKMRLFKWMSDTIQTTQKRGTDLIRIETFAKEEEQAQQIAYAIVRTYEKRRLEIILTNRNKVINKYRKKIKQQEIRVEEKRLKLFEASERLGIPYLGIEKNQAQMTPKQTNPKNIVTTEDHTLFSKIKDEYEREFGILQSINSFNLPKIIMEKFEFDPLIYHQDGWADHIPAMMEARKIKTK